MNFGTNIDGLNPKMYRIYIFKQIEYTAYFSTTHTYVVKITINKWK